MQFSSVVSGSYPYIKLSVQGLTLKALWGPHHKTQLLKDIKISKKHAINLTIASQALSR